MLVLTQGFDLRPSFTAFFARSPAPIMTEGLDVLVQLVMAAITTAPSCSLRSTPSSWQLISGGASRVAVAAPADPPSLTQVE